MNNFDQQTIIRGHPFLLHEQNLGDEEKFAEVPLDGNEAASAASDEISNWIGVELEVL